jgi:hypothetical protein
MGGYNMQGIHGKSTTLNFHKKIKSYESSMKNWLSGLKASGVITDELEDRFRQVVSENENSPTLKYQAFLPIFNKLGLRTINSLQVITFCKIYGGTYSTLAFREMYKHSQIKFDICKEIYFLLKDLRLLDEADKFNLFVGRKEPEDRPTFSQPKKDLSRTLFESENYVFKVGTYLNIQDTNHREAKLWANWTNELLCPIEYIYPDKNVLVFPKVKSNITEDEYQLGLQYLKASGWTPENPYKLKFSKEDFCSLNGRLVLFDYWNNEFENWKLE